MNSIDIIYSYMYSCEDEKKVLSVIDVHEKNITNKIPVLYAAVLARRSNIVEQLLKKGYSPNKPCKHGIYPLHMAVSSLYGLCNRTRSLNDSMEKLYNSYISNAESLKLSKSIRIAIFRELVRGKNISKKDLLLLGKEIDEEQINIIKLLLDYGADINAVTSLGTSALLDAVYEENIEIIKLLISYGIDTYIRSNNGVTAFILAAKIKDINIIRYIVEHYDGYKYYLYDSTAINEAINRNSIDILSFLLDLGLDTTVKDIFGNTPLHTAVICNNYNITKLLLERGVDPNIRNQVGRTPLYGACRYGKIILLLLDYGAYVITTDKNDITPIDTMKFLIDNKSYLSRTSFIDYYESAKLLIANIIIERFHSPHIINDKVYIKIIDVINNSSVLSNLMVICNLELEKIKKTNIYSNYYFDLLLYKYIEPDIFRNHNIIYSINKKLKLFPIYKRYMKKN
ncbi:ankyrin repeat protein [Cheloniid poxvirus 1]|nr:ankyrin repeat protein [Cheloniid poxvirus 1]